jgi:hypothetical protein
MLQKNDALYQGTTSQAAEKLKTEGDGGFIPRVKPMKSKTALAAEGRLLSNLSESPGFSATCSVVPKGAVNNKGF